MVFTAIEQPQTSGNCHLQVRGHAIDGMGHILGMDNPAGDPFMHEFDCGNTVIKNFPFAIANPAAPLEYYVALPRGTTKSTTIYRWRPPPGMTPPALELALGETVNSFSGGDFDLCNGDLFVGSRDNQTILPIPVGTATQPSIAQLDQVPRPIVWEPYTRRLFTFGRSLGGVMHSVSALEVDDSNVPTKLTPVAGFPMFPQMVPYAAAAKTPVLGNMDLCP
jgi:hypothetical protein